MMNRITFFFILIAVTFNSIAFAQTEKSNLHLYEKAFEEQLQMLNGKKPIDFKRAVFITENAYHNGKLDYYKFCNEITSIGKNLKELIQQRGLQQYKTSGNWAVFTFMTDSLAINNYTPYSYDFIDFFGEKDWKSTFVTKLMETKTGNCHSLPIFYKILCDEIGAKSSLALAPNHLYIKHIDENGQWTNLELTNGGFPRDQWIIKEMAITVEAIKSGAYMQPLTDKENIALTIFDLASAYLNQHGYDDFLLKITDTALNYFPKCLPLLMVKANYYKDLGLTEQKKSNPNPQFLKNNYIAYKEVLSLIDGLGYKDMPIEQYEEWIKSVEAEKLKRGFTSNE